MKKNNYEYWDNVWMGNDYSRDDLRRIKAKKKVEKLLKYINIKKDWKVIDFGCGPGYVSEALYDSVECSITCVDSSMSAIRLAEKRLGNYPIVFLHSDVCSTQICGESYDLAICCGIIEHVIKREDFLKEIYRLLKPNGYLFVVSSNRYSLIWPQRLIKQLLGIWPFGYQVNLALKPLSQLIQNNGFCIDAYEMINDIGDYQLIGKIDYYLSKVFSCFGRYIVLVCRKE